MAEKILIIEDEFDVLENLETILSEEGYDTITAKEGKTGIELAKSEMPDLIICDITMPGVDGYTVLNELSKDKNTRSTPFIFLTAKVERDDIRKGMQLGADDYLFKPFKIDELITSIKARLKRVEALRSETVIKNEDTFHSKYTAESKIIIHGEKKTQLITVKDIVFIVAENQYTSLNFIDEKTFIVRKSISYWEELLPAEKFLRIHRSTIISMDYITKIEKWYNASFLIYLKNCDKPFIVSKRYSSKLRKDMI